jgi:hypothetical protein
LGAEGWELVAIDVHVDEGEPAEHHYVFKRLM